MMECAGPWDCEPGFGWYGGKALTHNGLILALAMTLAAQQAGTAQAPAAAQQAIPDAPRPQIVPLGKITPGEGTTSTSNGDAAAASDTASDGQRAPGATLPGTALPASPSSTQAAPDDGATPDLPAAGQGQGYIIRQQVNFVEVPFTVKDNKGKLVPGLTWRDVRIYENGLRQQMRLFTVDPFPLSVALVVDQSLTFDNMAKVNNALAAMQGAFAAYDEVAVFTYNNGPRQITDFTAASSNRLADALIRAKGAGREPLQVLGGPLAQNIYTNGGAQASTMPLVNSSHGTSQMQGQYAPKEVHTLNDAILEAAKATTKAGKGRRRVVFVISDGREYGSKAGYKEVVKFLQQNKIAVYGTLVGDSSLPVIGFLDRIHLPFQMRDNILPAYALDTGGQFDAEFRQKGIETSFAKIAEEVRTQYTIGYYTHEPFIDGKFRALDVRVLRPNLQVIAKKGYYPTAQDIKPNVAVPISAAP